MNTAFPSTSDPVSDGKLDQRPQAAKAKSIVSIVRMDTLHFCKHHGRTQRRYASLPFPLLLKPFFVSFFSTGCGLTEPPCDMHFHETSFT